MYKEYRLFSSIYEKLQRIIEWGGEWREINQKTYMHICIAHGHRQ